MSDTPETDALAAEHRGAVIWPDFARRLERERDEARERVKDLAHENENLYRRLESVHEVYRLSSVCRELKAENEKLKAKLEEKEEFIQRVITWPHDADPFFSLDHDNDTELYR